MTAFPPSTVDRRALYSRSPFQVGLLFFVTLGVYVFWWSYYVRRSVAAMLEEPDQPFWNSVALVVPLLNLFVLYGLFEKIKTASLRAGQQPPPALAAWGFAGVFIFFVFSRLPIPYEALAMLYFIPFAIAHFYFAHAEMRLMGREAIPRSFGVFEIIVVVLGLGFRVLIMIGYTFTLTGKVTTMLPDAWFAWLVLLFVAGAFVVLYRRSDALVTTVVSKSDLSDAHAGSAILP